MDELKLVKSMCWLGDCDDISMAIDHGVISYQCNIKVVVMPVLGEYERSDHTPAGLILRSQVAGRLNLSLNAVYCI